MFIPWKTLCKDIVETCSTYDNVIVMTSGGVDSIFLLDFIIRNTDINPIVLHFQHGIRKDDHHEYHLVEKISKNHNLTFVSGKGINLRDCKNQESVARVQRWNFVENLISTLQGTSMTITAHHYDDNIENFFMSAVRGRSVSSLVMKKFQYHDTYTKYKPLLDITKEEIYIQAKKRKLVWIEDPTNKELDHERNIFRNKIIPELKNIRNITRSMRRLIKELSDG